MEYFEQTSPNEYRFLDYYQYRRKQDDFTCSFRREADSLQRYLNSLVESRYGGPAEVPRRGILQCLRRGDQPALW
ncbi:hypothetical protein Glove_92g19 [Diversispora epigaea]|uniref:Uncharacterized protein n=1 Tax=Diversispora epigaea TaxID=1348612 RepID=A0A397JFR5_9GLOM|nr:hypothetical protein Glove_92g19 [Diversispora epigaea]